MAKKLLGPWSVLYPVNFYSGGDTTRQAFGKHIQEITRIYGLLNALDAGKAGSEEIAEALQNLLHNSLKGLQGGSATERYHLTAAQVSKLEGAAASGDIIKIHNNLQNIQGGSATERYHLTQAQVTKLNNAPDGKDHNTNLTGLQGGTATERYHLTKAQVDKLNGAAGAGDIVKSHNSLSDLYGGAEPNNYFHLRNDQVNAVMGLMAISDNTGYSIHNKLQGLQGGADSERYHLTKAQLDKLNGAAGSGDIVKSHNGLSDLYGGEAPNNYFHLTNDQVSAVMGLMADTNGTGRVKSAIFAGELLNSNGYVKFSNGLILQWGKTATYSPSNYSNETMNVTQAFPIAFPSQCFVVVLGTFMQGGDRYNFYNMMVRGYSNSSFTYDPRELYKAETNWTALRGEYVALGR